MGVGAVDIPGLSSQVTRVTRAPESQNPSVHHYSVRRISSSCTWFISAYVLAFTGPRRQTRLIPISRLKGTRQTGDVGQGSTHLQADNPTSYIHRPS